MMQISNLSFFLPESTLFFKKWKLFTICGKFLHILCNFFPFFSKNITMNLMEEFNDTGSVIKC
jgi:hypothetical protein